MTAQATRVGIGVPVWRGGAFVAEALDSILAQRDVRMQMFISIDGDDADSERHCQPFLSDPRVRLVRQPRRLGWVGNTAAVLAGATEQGAGFVCIHPHDDLMETGYLATLVAAAAENPNASVVYCDIATFGDMDGSVTQPSVEGSPVERLVTLLSKHYSAVAYRGLTRVSALQRVPPISGNRVEDFACDTVWMARLARVGDLVRVPRTLYRKRIHPDSTHMTWTAWPHQQKIDAWLQHCLDMLAEALAVSSEAAHRRLMVEAARARMLQSRHLLGPYHAAIARMPRDEKRELWKRFQAAAAARPDIGPLDEATPSLASRLIDGLAGAFGRRTSQ